MNNTTPINPLSNPFVRQHYQQLRHVLANVRWLKRACGFLLLLNIFLGFGLWLIKHPQTIGF